MKTQSAAREVRAPRGTELSAKSWLTEAPLRMLMNNLDPDVAERPEDLVVYGGIGKAARNWEAFDFADPVRQAGRRLPHARECPTRPDRELQPRAALGELGAFP
jgi:hypothetical protein